MIIEPRATIELDLKRLDEILGRVDARELQADDYQTIHALIESYVGLAQAVGDKNATIARLRKLIFGAKTETTAAVTGGRNEAEAQTGLSIAPVSEGDAPAASVAEGAVEAAPASAEATAESASGVIPTRRRGHGRNRAEAYTGAERIEVPHPSLQPGDACPDCEQGAVYETARPGVLVRLVGQAPVGAKVWYLQKLRCNLCGALFTAEPPAGVGPEKYDATVGSVIGVLKYGSGMPFYRAEKVQASLGIPLPASTQWDIVARHAERAEPVFEELIREAAQGEVLANDDTTVKILESMGERGRQAALARAADAAADSGENKPQKSPQRRGTFTSGIVSTREGRRIALFLSGHQHAGENLADVLARRASDLPPPIQMCDALARNAPGELATILANCMAHGRRQFVEVIEAFPDECRHVLESLSVIYHNDALAREQGLSPEERLRLHQDRSGPTMEALHGWLTAQFDERRVEPNSSLGKAIAYMLRHWQKLTLFLRVAGAPLDNNACERALKKAILHRKNAYFYLTSRGAHVGDLFMSLIHTCELNGANPFDYLAELHRHAALASAHPQDWMPWNYRQTLAGVSAPDSPSAIQGSSAGAADQPDVASL